MRFTGIAEGRETAVARVFDDGSLARIAEVGEFYRDLDRWTEHASGLGSGDLPASTTELPAVPLSARVACVGLNYRRHAEETGQELPKRPPIFARWTATLVASGTPVPVPAGERGLDWEGELVAVVGRTLADVSPEEALEGVFGYAAFNDLSARRHQGHSAQWTVGKNADRSGPISPIVTADEVGDPAAGLRLVTRVNGETVQDSTTADMIHPVGAVLSYLSGVMTLNPGDLLATGTPEGVGFARRPPRYLLDGDSVEVEVERIGLVRNPIVANRSRMAAEVASKTANRFR